MSAVASSSNSNEISITLFVQGGQFGVPDATFVLNRDVALFCGALKNLIEDIGDMAPIPVTNIHPTIMNYVVEFIKQQHEESLIVVEDTRTAEEKEDDEEEAMISPPNPEYLNEWEKLFIEQFENEMLWEICQAANTLDIPQLIDLWAKRVASLVRGKTREEMQDILRLRNTRTFKEQVDLFEENGWQPPTFEEYTKEQERIAKNFADAAAHPFVMPIVPLTHALGYDMKVASEIAAVTI